MAYCCVMGTTGLDEKMYNIIGHWGLRLAGSILLILNAMVVVSFCYGYTHSHEKLPIIRCPISLLATLLSVRQDYYDVSAQCRLSAWYMRFRITVTVLLLTEKCTHHQIKLSNTQLSSVFHLSIIYTYLQHSGALECVLALSYSSDRGLRKLVKVGDLSISLLDCMRVSDLDKLMVVHKHGHFQLSVEELSSIGFFLAAHIFMTIHKANDCCCKSSLL